MTVTNLVLPNLYRDSVMLMRISQELERLDGVRRATAMMGTPNNRSLLSDAGLLTDEGDSASPNDLILAIEASPDLDSASVVSRAQELLKGDTGPR
ncbi:MAG: acyl-CoA synthetase FdrA, partial [Chloroflexi bacterium]|nr:acyl-CoA synthetase FdrA [Chloroflexota bacterium]